MKRLSFVFATLLVVAFAAAGLGLFLSRGRTGAITGPIVLRFDVAGDLREQAPGSGLRLPGFDEPVSFARVYSALVGARDDTNVKGVVVRIDDASFGIGKAQELRDLLIALQKSGKFVRCYMDSAGEGGNGTLEYYLASACGHIALAPAGEVNLIGLFADSSFLRGTLEKLKIEAAYAHAGKYKSAPETFTEYGYSPAAREAMGALLDSEFSQIVRGIAERRKLPQDDVRALIDQAPLEASTALSARLVDALMYPDEFLAATELAVGEKPRYLDLVDYHPAASFAGRHVAVVFAAGTIVRGGGGEQPWTRELFVGSESLSETLRSLAEDDSVAAVVLRIDSPGGSALASDLIQREVVNLQQHKPVVVSMSDLAASGGYYIAARAKKIVAQPGTLTGSIGVFAGKFTTRRFQQDWLGVTHETLKRGANADYFSTLDPFRPEQAERFSQGIEHTYSRFVGVVAAGRTMTTAAVDAVAQGRVWTGEDALHAGLVDELGGLERAIALSREYAKIPKGQRVQLRFLPDSPGLLELLFGRRQAALPSALVELFQQVVGSRQESLELPRELSRLSRPF